MPTNNNSLIIENGKSNHNSDLTFTNVKDVKSMLGAFEIIKQSHPSLTKSQYQELLKEMIGSNQYQMVLVHLDKNLVAVAGISIFTMLYCGRYMQISNLVVDSQYRNLKIGEAVLGYCQQMAIDHKCNKLVLDSYIENKLSHNLYYRQGFYIRGFHFMKDLKPFAMNY